MPSKCCCQELTAGEIKVKYESNYDTNAFTNEDKLILGKLTENFESGYTFITVDEPTYTVLSSDEFIGVAYSATGTTTVSLPQISSIGLKRYYITDTGGNASMNNITIDTTGGDTIIGNTSVIVSGNYDSISLYNDGLTGWFIF